MCVRCARPARESVRDTSPCAGKLHFKYTASQSVNSKSDLSLRGPESTAWCTMVPTSGSLHCPMLQFVPCFQGGGRDGNRAEVHGHPWIPDTEDLRGSLFIFNIDNLDHAVRYSM